MLLEALDVVLYGRLLVDVVGVEARQLAAGPALGERPERDRAPRLLRRLDRIEPALREHVDVARDRGQPQIVGRRGALLDELLDEFVLARLAQAVDPGLNEPAPLGCLVERRRPRRVLALALAGSHG